MRLIPTIFLQNEKFQTFTIRVQGHRIGHCNHHNSSRSDLGKWDVKPRIKGGDYLFKFLLFPQTSNCYNELKTGDRQIETLFQLNVA